MISIFYFLELLKNNGVIYGFAAGQVLAMTQRAQNNILGTALFWRAAQIFGNSIAFMFPVSTSPRQRRCPFRNRRLIVVHRLVRQGQSRNPLFQNLLPPLPHTPKRNI